MSGYFIGLLLHPTATLERLLRERPSFRRIILFLAGLGLGRGLLDGLWLLLTHQQFQALGSEVHLVSWHVTQIGPLLLADGVAAYIRWLGFAFVPYALGRFMGGRGRLEDCLRVYGAVMGIYVVTALLNAVYFFAPLPMIQFRSAPAFSPGWGIGQILTSLWLAYISYRVVQRLHHLSRIESMMIGLMVPTLNLGALLGLGFLFQNFLTGIQGPAPVSAAGGYLVFSLGSLGLLLIWIVLTAWIIRRESLSSSIFFRKGIRT
jgi:hypothetical protein